MPIMLGAAARTLGGLIARTVGSRSAIAAGAAGRTVGGTVGTIARGVGRALPTIAGIGGGTALGNLLTPRFAGVAGRPRRRGRGITAAELRGARKVASLVRMYGMKPKAGKIGRRRCR